MKRTAASLLFGAILVTACSPSTLERRTPLPAPVPTTVVIEAGTAATAVRSPATRDHFETVERGDVASLAPIPAIAVPHEALAISIDNTIATGEWSSAGRHEIAGHDLVSGLWWAFDSTTLYIRVDFAREVLGEEAAGIDIYVDVPGTAPKRNLSRGGNALGFGATDLIMWRGTDPQAIVGPIALPQQTSEAPLSPADLPDPRAVIVAGFDGSRIEFALSLESLGPVHAGDRLLVRIVDRTGGREGSLAPVTGPATLLVPDIPLGEDADAVNSGLVPAPLPPR